MHPEMTATKAPISTERDTPSHCHGHVHGARTPRASGHTCTQTRGMHTYRGTWARTRLGNLYRDARRLCETVTHRGTLALGVHTHIHTAPGTPSFPFLTPFPPFPSPLTSLGQSHPSSFRSKSASSQGGERCQCAFSLPPPRLAGSACPPPTPPTCQRGMHTLPLHRTSQRCSMWRQEPPATIQVSSPAPPASPPCPSPPHWSLATPELGSLSGCQGRFGVGLCGLKLTLPPSTPDQTLEGADKRGGFRVAEIFRRWRKYLKGEVGGILGGWGARGCKDIYLGASKLS